MKTTNQLRRALCLMATGTLLCACTPKNQVEGPQPTPGQQAMIASMACSCISA